MLRENSLWLKIHQGFKTAKVSIKWTTLTESFTMKFIYFGS